MPHRNQRRPVSASTLPVSCGDCPPFGASARGGCPRPSGTGTIAGQNHQLISLLSVAGILLHFRCDSSSVPLALLTTSTHILGSRPHRYQGGQQNLDRFIEADLHLIELAFVGAGQGTGQLVGRQCGEDGRA